MKGIRRVNSLALRLLLAVFAGIAAPPLMAQQVSSLPKPTDYVSDNAQVLSSQAIARIDSLCTQLDHSAANAQIAVVTVHNLNGDDAADYANQLEDAWKIGPKGADRGVLVLLAVDDHKYRIDVGYGLEGILPDAKVGDIGREMVPYLRSGNYDSAVTQAVNQVAQVIAADAKITLEDEPIQPQPEPQQRPAAIRVFQIIVVVIVVLLYLFRVLGSFGLFGLWGLGLFGGFGGGRGGGGGFSGGGGGGGGFGGFGGGSFGGGGAGGSW